MLKESIIFVMLILFSIEDIRKRRIDVLPLLVFLVIGILYQAITRSLTIPEICGGAFLGVCLLGIVKVTGESLGYGDGLLFLVTGIYIGGWDNCSLLMTSLILVFVFAIIQILVRKKSAKSEIPFVPFVLSAYMLYLGGQMI